VYATTSFIAGAAIAILVQVYLALTSKAVPVSPVGYFAEGRPAASLFESLRTVLVGLSVFFAGGYVVGMLGRHARRGGAGYAWGVATAQFGILIASSDEGQGTVSFLESLIATVSVSSCVAAIGVLLGGRTGRGGGFRGMFGLTVFLAACWPAAASAQAAATSAQEEHVERSFVLELGGAAEWDARHLSSGHYGPTVAVETEPIEGWLELELGVTPFISGGRTNVDVDLLFKKPFNLSPKVELMVGLGPTLSHRFAREDRGTSYGLEFALDFMFWPTKKIGWFVEPSYAIEFGGDKERSFGVTAGLLIAY